MRDTNHSATFEVWLQCLKFLHYRDFVIKSLAYGAMAGKVKINCFS